VKVGCGIDHFQAMMTIHGTQCFRIIRIDGSGTDFSYPSCVTGRQPARKQEVSEALRRVVQTDTYKACKAFFSDNKDADGTVKCAVTVECITRDQAHMDHRPPLTFEVIVNTFLTSNGLAVDQVPITTGRDEQIAPEVTDPVFRRYHNKVATLDLVKKATNLAQSTRHRIKRTRIQIEPKPDFPPIK
jgi:hypothetical protein